MRYVRMPIEVESPEEYGNGKVRYNLSESSIADQSLGSLGLTVPDLTLLYGEHRGSERLRELVLEDTPGLGIDDVLITGGAAGALFIIATALLGPDDHLVVVKPNYATRSEEHTSELQSLMRISYAVFCLQKKKHHRYITNLN